MKILKLELQAFGPFKDHEMIDFSLFEENRIFLIGGKTGSGKTTIFDAISYALFGKMTGEYRDDSTARSQYATKDTDTFVRLTFLKDERVYEIYRKPGYLLEGRKSPCRPEICLKEITNGADNVLSIKIADANNKIIDIIGFKYEQFKQIVVLPQGEFIKILNAKSKEREELLSAILDTSLYSNITATLKDRARDLEKRISDVTIKTDAILKDNKVNNIDELKSIKESLEADLRAKRKEVDTKAWEAKALDKKIEAIEKNNTNINSLQSINDKLDKLIIDNSNINEDRRELESLKAIKEITGDYNLLEAKRSDLRAVENSLKDNTSRFNLLKPEYDRILEYNNALLDSIKKIDDVNRRLNELSEIKKKNNELIKAKLILKNDRDLLNKVEASLDRQLKGIKDSEREISSNKLIIEENLKFTSSYNNSLFKEAKAKYEAIVERLKLEERLKGYQNAISEAKSLLDSDNKTLSELNIEYDRIDNIIKNNELLRFKDMIKENEPCPLCGSISHPNPIFFKELGSISLDSINKAINATSLRINKNENKIELNNKEIALIKENPIYKLDINEFSAVESEFMRLSADQDKYFKLLDINNNLASKNSSLDALVKKANLAIDSLKNRINDLKLNINNNESLIKRLSDDINSYLNGEDINTIEGMLNNSLKKLKALKATQEDKIDNIKKEYTALNTSINSNNERKASLNSEISALDLSFTNSLNKLKLTIEAFKEALAKLKQIPILEARINNYDNLAREYKSKIEVLESLITGNDLIDTTALKDDLKELNDASDSLNKEYLSLNSSYTLVDSGIKTYLKITASIKDTLEEYKVVEYMYELCSGSLKGSKKISIQKFVLMKLLDKILTYANHYLKLFSSSRYTLLREEGDSTSDKGLELVVYDDHTGYQRSVSSLSGGESFMTALALALGMSECIMSMNGGIRMENIFIDEGFGSLDDEALNNAIEALIELAQGGRLIGIISHVDSIKALIPQGIMVNKTKHGSKIEMNL